MDKVFVPFSQVLDGSVNTTPASKITVTGAGEKSFVERVRDMQVARFSSLIVDEVQPFTISVSADDPSDILPEWAMVVARNLVQNKDDLNKLELAANLDKSKMTGQEFFTSGRQLGKSLATRHFMNTLMEAKAYQATVKDVITTVVHRDYSANPIWSCGSWMLDRAVPEGAHRVTIGNGPFTHYYLDPSNAKDGVIEFERAPPVDARAGLFFTEFYSREAHTAMSTLVGAMHAEAKVHTDARRNAKKARAEQRQATKMQGWRSGPNKIRLPADMKGKK